ncbi:M24 family metallopeptidase, partial [uncultured Duncaniella sp.]|uniref:M24 family metallopeptidase n=1 Tax=uncultured Duncaniella sp. TaxID=2768039 RepID=UPI0025B75C7E
SEGMMIGIEAAKPGARIGDIANAVQTYCEKRNYSVVREMCGHGIGRHMHEDPEVPNYGRRGIGHRLQDGMCICIEPMINMGSRNIVIEPNGWECRTRDRKPSAHFEHTVAIVDGRTEVLTTFDYIPSEIMEKFI